MLKMDVEGSEIKGIDAWLKQGSLDNVNQIAIEYHLVGGKWIINMWPMGLNSN